MTHRKIAGEIAAALASLMLVSCASAPRRNPAQEGPGVPYVPGSSGHGSGSSSSSSTTAPDPNAPADGSASNSAPGSNSPGPRDNYGYVNPRDPNWKGPNDNSWPKAPGEQGQVGWPQPGTPPDPNVCNIRFDKVPAGTVPVEQGGLSVQDLIWHASQYGQQQQNWQAQYGGQYGQYGQQYGQYGQYGQPDWSRDQQIFAGYLTYTASGSQVQAAAMYSGPFQQALLAAQGRGNIYGMKMAAIISAMIATKSDPACTSWIRNHANGVLGPWARDLDLLPFVAAAEFYRSKVGANGGTRLDAEFRSVEQQLQDQARKAKQLDRKVNSLTKQNDNKLKSLDNDVARQVKSLKLDLKKITECRSSSSVSVSDLGEEQEHDDAVAMVDDCKETLKNKVADFDIEIKDLQDRIDAAKSKDKTKDVERLTARKKDIEDRKVKANENLATLNTGLASLAELEKAVKLRDSLREEIRSGLRQNTDAAGKPAAPTPTEVAAAIQEQARLQQSMRALYPQYLTYGYMGGYPWAQQYYDRHMRAWPQMGYPQMQQRVPQRYPGSL